MTPPMQNVVVKPKRRKKLTALQKKGRKKKRADDRDDGDQLGLVPGVQFSQFDEPPVAVVPGAGRRSRRRPTDGFARGSADDSGILGPQFFQDNKDDLNNALNRVADAQVDQDIDDLLEGDAAADEKVQFGAQDIKLDDLRRVRGKEKEAKKERKQREKKTQYKPTPARRATRTRLETENAQIREMFPELKDDQAAVEAKRKDMYGSGVRAKKPNAWVEHIRAYATEHGIPYGQALSDPACRAAYRGGSYELTGESPGDIMMLPSADEM